MWSSAFSLDSICRSSLHPKFYKMKDGQSTQTPELNNDIADNGNQVVKASKLSACVD
jgi:hypothetical protein